ncbi:MAG: glycosyltransferase [Intestinimonas butyriciproducens]|uniref:glycosyltransferase n=1 Tax=Intestinimonas butyriciproducens TaxID=1297617 RepID=UPI0039930F1F
MATISLCMIVKNEEAVLGRCLDSAAGLVDEIVVVDTGSTDATREIATRYADRVCEFAWIDDFAAARNFAFAQASMEYCMWLDADDVLLMQDREKFLDLKRSLPASVDVVMMKYHTAFDRAGNPTFSYYRSASSEIRDGPCGWEGSMK